MKVDPFRCDCCSAEPKDLLLIETRFGAHRCIAELQCRMCNALWAAELGPAAGDDRQVPETEDQGKWQVLSLTPLIAN